MAGQIIDKTNSKISVINFFLKKVKCTKHTCSENKKQCILTKVLLFFLDCLKYILKNMIQFIMPSEKQ